MKLRDRLEEIDERLSVRLRVIEQKAHQLLEFSQAGAHMSYTTHGLSHVSWVEQSYDWLLSAEDVAGFNSREIFCLLCATLWHDAWMIPTKLGREKDARRDHATKSRDQLVSVRPEGLRVI